MRIYKIVLFIFVAIALLGTICFFFPADGVQIGQWKLRFPSLERILTRNVESPVDSVQDVAAMEDIINEAELNSLQDSLEMYKQLINSYISRFYLPNDDMTYFDAFFEKAAAARAQGKTIRVMHYGDSQIELDRISKELRTFFQSKFGGGGPGLLPIVQSVPKATVTQWASESYITYTAYGIGNRDSQNQYGLMARYFRLIGSGTCSFSNTRTNKVRLLLYDNKGDFKATLKEKNGEYVEEKVCDSTTGFKIIQWDLPYSLSAFSLQFSGNANLYGVMVDNGGGVQVDNIPMRGCSGTIFTKMGRELLQKSYGQTDVEMIILQYGGNAMPALKTNEGVDYYKTQIANQIKYLKSTYPDVPVLFIGPSDMSTRVNGVLTTYPLLPELIQALKEVALQNGCAFWDIYEVMGGQNSMLAWVRQGLAGNDYVHFTPAGANKIGTNLVDAFATMYDYHCLSRDIKNGTITSVEQLQPIDTHRVIIDE